MLAITIRAFNNLLMGNLELFHGSMTSGIQVLEPRVASNGSFPGRIETPAVYASTDIDYAIFMAVIGNRYWGGWDSSKYPGKGFYIHEELCADLTDSSKEISGMVYFLNSLTFKKIHGEWRSEFPVQIIGSLAVGVADLPPVTITLEPHPYNLRRKRTN